MSEAIFEKLCLPGGCRRVLCAVSGGADSVCLLHLLCAVSHEKGLEVYAAHYEHGIRGAESLRDADFVKELCAALDVELMVEHGDVPRYAAEKHTGTEEAARELRYAFLERAADAFGCDCIATAHNADDNAETMLFNLARGSGAKGLQGIPARRGRIIRPIIGVTRAEIEAYLASINAAHVEDSTNAADEYSRNRIRHRVMPELRRVNPGCAAAMARTAALLRQDDDFISAEASRFIDGNFDGESVDAAALCALHPAVSSRVVRALWPRALSQAHVDAVLALARGGGLGFADVPGGRVRREQGRVYFRTSDDAAVPERVITPGEILDVPEAGLRIRAFFSVYSEEIHGLFKTYCLRCESIYGNLRCTGRMPGDRFSPMGRGCTKSLKSLFTERHMTQRQRNATAVIRDDRGIAAVAGFGADERFRPQPGDRVLCIEIENYNYGEKMI